MNIKHTHTTSLENHLALSIYKTTPMAAYPGVQQFLSWQIPKRNECIFPPKGMYENAYHRVTHNGPQSRNNLDVLQQQAYSCSGLLGNKGVSGASPRPIIWMNLAKVTLGGKEPDRKEHTL